MLAASAPRASTCPPYRTLEAVQRTPVRCRIDSVRTQRLSTAMTAAIGMPAIPSPCAGPVCRGALAGAADPAGATFGVRRGRAVDQVADHRCVGERQPFAGAPQIGQRGASVDHQKNGVGVIGDRYGLRHIEQRRGIDQDEVGRLT